MNGMQTDVDFSELHYGRSFGGPGDREAECPCPKQPCGLVSSQDAEQVRCPEHRLGAAKTIRVFHRASDCPEAPHG